MRMKKLISIAALVAAAAFAIEGQAATYNVVSAKHATLILATVDTVNMSGVCSYVNAYNAGLTDLFLRLDGTNPASSADDSFRVNAGAWQRLVNPTPYSTQIKLISSVAVTYTVECE